MKRVSQIPIAAGLVCGVTGVGALALAGLNGNALAAVLGYTLLFGLLFHAIVSFACIRNFEIVLRPKTRRGRAYEPIPFEARIRNRSRWLPIYKPRFKVEETGKGKSQTVLVPQTLSPGETVTLLFYPQFGRRGHHCIRLLEAFAYFPFGFTRTALKTSVESETVTIWPQAAPVPEALFRSTENRSPVERPASRRRFPDTLDPNYIRAYANGDSKRRIHWKLSAKAGELVVLDSPATQVSLITLSINTHPSHWRRPVDFENGLRLFASALQTSFARQLLAEARIDDETLPIQRFSDLERVLDHISDRRMNDAVDPETRFMEKGDFLVKGDRSGPIIVDWRKRKVGA